MLSMYENQGLKSYYMLPFQTYCKHIIWDTVQVKIINTEDEYTI